MSKIKKISFSDISEIKKLISVVCSDNILDYRRLFLISVPTTIIQNFFYSVHLRKFEENYVVTDNNDVLKGLITIQAKKGNPYSWIIKRLLLAPNCHEQGKQLIEYIVAKFGARGVDTFSVSVDDNAHELIDLFIKGCGFRFCSTDSIWQNTNLNFLVEDFEEKNFKTFISADAQKVAELHNDNLITHYKYSLLREKDEFYEATSSCFDSDTEFKYVYETEKNKIIGYLKIKKPDDKNYSLDIILPPQYFELYPKMLSFAVKKIVKRNKNFKLHIKNKKYHQTGEMVENFLKENNFELIQTNAMLVRDFFKTVKEESKSFNEAVVLIDLKSNY